MRDRSSLGNEAGGVCNRQQIPGPSFLVLEHVRSSDYSGSQVCMHSVRG
jgi:hypothetical protein